LTRKRDGSLKTALTGISNLRRGGLLADDVDAVP